jgi:hypothetical protein
MKHILLYLLMSIIGSAGTFAQKSYAEREREEEIQRAGNALRRYMEWAHPTPVEYAEKPALALVPLVSSSILGNPLFFENENMIIAETDQLPVQNESSIAVNPTNPKNLIGSAVDYRAQSSTWVYTSTDAGRTWRNINLGKPAGMQTSSNDPSVIFSVDGTGYLVYGAFGNRAVASPENGVYFSRTTDGGATWKSHIPVIKHTGTQTPDSNFEDKYYIHVDNSPSSPYFKRLYIPWKRVVNRDSSTQIVNVYSTDNGDTWSQPVPVSRRLPGSSEDTTFGQSFPLTITGPAGQVYTIWNYGPEKGIGFARSDNGGQSYLEQKIIQRYKPFGTAKALAEGVRHTVKGGVRAESYPSIVCDLTNGPRRGWLYLVWAADQIPNIYFSRSTDGGDTWSPARIIHSDTTNDQFWSWISLDPLNGDIAVMYLDSRDDPNNIITNCYISYSRDGGDTWLDRRASDANSDLRNNPFQNNVFAGDYSGCAFYNGIIYPSWVDMRNATPANRTDNDVYTAIVNTRIPQPPDPFVARPSSQDTTAITLFWTPPSARAFGQPLAPTEYTYALYRNNTFLAALPAQQTSYRDTTVIAFRTYRYAIRTIAGTDTSVERTALAIAGGARLPQPVQILRQTPLFTPVNAVDFALRIPSFRADSITPLINAAAVIIYRNGVKIGEQAIQNTDTGRIITVRDNPPQRGWYRYSFSIRDNSPSRYESARTPEQPGYAGIVENTLSENFDAAELPLYLSGGLFARTTALARSAPNSLTESPNGQYQRNQRDTLMFFPIRKSMDEKILLSFWHAALVDAGDSALIEVSEDYGRTWNRLAAYNQTQFAAWSDGTLDAQDWKPEQITITAQSDTLILRLRFRSNASIQAEGWFIDDIRLNTVTGNIQDISIAAAPDAWPLPASDYITLGNMDNSSVQALYTSAGALIDASRYQVENLGNGGISIEIGSLLPGHYTALCRNSLMQIQRVQFIISR